MKRTRSFRLVAAGVVVALTSAVAVSTTTQSASANDYQIIADNLDDALGVLLTGFSDAAETYLATQSVQAAANVLSSAIVAAGTALVAGTAQFGALPFGLSLFVGSFMGNIAPYLAALDDPSTAADLFNPDDLSTLLANLPTAVTGLILGSDVNYFGGTDEEGIADAVADLLQGRIQGTVFFPGLATDHMIGALAEAVASAISDLTEGTSYSGMTFTAAIGMLVGAGALDGFAGAYIQSMEDTLGPLLNGQLGLVTGPVASLLSGLSLDLSTLPIALPFP